MKNLRTKLSYAFYTLLVAFLFMSCSSSTNNIVEEDKPTSGTKVRGNINVVEVTGNIETKVRIQCSRCLEEYETVIIPEFSLTFMPEEGEDPQESPDNEIELNTYDMQVVNFSGGIIELKDSVQEQVVLDSLHIRLNSAEEDSARIKALWNLSEYYGNFDLLRSVQYSAQALKIAQKIDDQYRIANSHLQKGKFFVFKGLTDEGKFGKHEHKHGFPMMVDPETGDVFSLRLDKERTEIVFQKERKFRDEILLEKLKKWLELQEKD